ncbi:threonine dehydratase [Verminephrobacter eiseniae]|uniref:threonine dehydratase n=1 Tax=Verminephrobacter eiseniae TaxID=364317 RepID=UPI0022385B14|nr:threonine dehydratase [Verminephrobacter eiseniae]MCW5232744.1 threonine dehydratase [Verminephrobacter eiseniae]MCW5295692.1 threonine dehydratase [Verminephrobacter eiseniae]MCW8186771.1 threonine dehydratase [Verminephrobacter eiseniae]MCW8221809.1 threonine dehydratase [Verminephrobacter eiseniae]MCW8232501.1 threonine dehydratase [Verminephrobacter eiseniae]
MNDLLLPGHAEIEQAAKLVYAAMPATPQYSWPLLNAALGTETWVKHENHTPTGAFKVRGGLVYLQARRASGVISATRGNHGQSVGFAARRYGIAATIVVPHGNSKEKNAAMRALGVTLVEHGKEFQESREHAVMLAQRDALHMIPSFHRDLVCGVATCWMELLRAQPDLDVLFVPIGQGSEICAAVAARRALNLRTRIIGVVSAHALAYKLSFESRSKVESPVTTLIADGVACRVPDESSLAVISDQVEEIMAVSDDEVAAAMKLYFTATHNVAEGAGAAALAAAMQIRPRLAGLRVGLALSGGNVDHDMFAQILSRPAVRTT